MLCILRMNKDFWEHIQLKGNWLSIHDQSVTQNKNYEKQTEGMTSKAQQPGTLRVSSNSFIIAINPDRNDRVRMMMSVTDVCRDRPTHPVKVNWMCHSVQETEVLPGVSLAPLKTWHWLKELVAWGWEVLGFTWNSGQNENGCLGHTARDHEIYTENFLCPWHWAKLGGMNVLISFS